MKFSIIFVGLVKWFFIASTINSLELIATEFNGEAPITPVAMNEPSICDSNGNCKPVSQKHHRRIDYKSKPSTIIICPPPIAVNCPSQDCLPEPKKDSIKTIPVPKVCPPCSPCPPTFCPTCPPPVCPACPPCNVCPKCKMVEENEEIVINY